MNHCDCCERDVTYAEWDGLYSLCHECAWCWSLEHAPCCHGECERDKGAS
jgi:hypothetical protein